MGIKMKNTTIKLLKQYQSAIRARSACHNEIGTDHYKKVNKTADLCYQKVCELLNNAEVTGPEIKPYLNPYT